MYHLRINNTSLFFHYWMNVVDWFHCKGLEPETEYLNTVTGKDFYLFEIVDIGEVWVTNESLIEKGDDYISIQLERITFQDLK